MNLSLTFERRGAPRAFVSSSMRRSMALCVLPRTTKKAIHQCAEPLQRQQIDTQKGRDRRRRKKRNVRQGVRLFLPSRRFSKFSGPPRFLSPFNAHLLGRHGRADSHGDARADGADGAVGGREVNKGSDERDRVFFFSIGLRIVDFSILSLSPSLSPSLSLSRARVRV